MKDLKKIIVSILLVIMISGSMIFTPNEVKALTPDVIGGPTTIIGYVRDKIKDVYKTMTGRVGGEVLNKSINHFAQKLAYSIATQIAEGGPGQKPMFRTVSISDHIDDALSSAAGDFLGQLSEQDWAKDLGLDLCNPSINIKLSVSLALMDEEQPPVPKCNWEDVKKNWSQFGENWKNEALLFELNTSSGSKGLKDFFASAKKGGSIGSYLVLKEELEERKKEEEASVKLLEMQCQGLWAQYMTVSEQVKTHCAAVAEIQHAQLKAAAEAEQETKANYGSFSDGLDLSTIFKAAAKTFKNTLAAKLMNNWIRKGTWSLFGDIIKDKKDGGGSSDSSSQGLLNKLRGGYNIYQPRNSALFSSLKTTKINKVADYNVLQEFSICPTDEDFRKPNNCVISTDFLSVVVSGKTVNQAIEEGLIDPSILLISPEDRARNNSYDCYKDSLCYSNLVKLRQANIIPIGWELAALRSSLSSPATLGEAIECFEDSPESDCVFDISNDYSVDNIAHNKFYHLIDGDWVLKSHTAMCDAYVHSSLLDAPESSDRAQICVDTKLCLREDDDGNCFGGQYGHCTVSENIWRFEGDICEEGEIYAGCLTFDHDDYGSNSYIESTLEYCTADQVGCKRYSQEDISEDEDPAEWVFQSIAIDDDDLFLNKNTNGCTEEDDGCSEFIVINSSNNSDHGPNIIPNGDFELDEDEDNIPDGWNSTTNHEYIDVDDPNAAECKNGSCIHITSSSSLVGMVKSFEVVPGSYNLSADVKFNGLADNYVYLNLGNCGYDSTCGSVVWQDSVDYTENNWGRINSSYTFDENTKYINIYVGLEGYTGSEAWIDNIQLEMVRDINVSSSRFSDYGEGGIIYMGGDRFMCTAEEVGCQGYIPRNGDPMIPAVINDSDLCPEECLGYATFTEQPSLFDVIEGSTTVEYDDFIPDTAQSCPIQEVDCEEFTNLDEVADGGEGKEYYTYLRQCVLGGLGSTYYTWEGSDTAGYQIRTWNALSSNLSSNAPCTNVDLASPDSCSDTSANIAACGEETPLIYHDDPMINPNCREFFDVSGNSFFRLQDRVIFATDNCHNYRRTKTATIFQAVPEDSTSCSKVNNGCLSYYGNTANNLREVFLDNFEAGSYVPWESSSDLDLSTESLNNNGESFHFQSGASIGVLRSLADKIQDNKEYQLSWWMKNASFLNSVSVSLNYEDYSGVVFSEPLSDISDNDLIDISGGYWHHYTISEYIGVLTENDADLSTIKLSFIFDGMIDDIFIDNVLLKEVSNSISVVEDSWVTPLSCDDPYEGYHLGCQSYMDINGNDYNLKSFNRLCRENVIGCSLVIDTHNSTYPFAQIFHLGDYSEITVPEDNFDYLVPDISKYCSNNLKGCMALGLPVRNSVGSEEFETKYIINNPDTYNSIMCNYDGLSCEEYNSSKGTYYFKDPELDTCTYQRDVLIVGVDGQSDVFEEVVSGWFKSGSLLVSKPVGCSSTFEYVEEGAWDNYDDYLPSFEDFDFLQDYCDGIGYYSQESCEDAGDNWTNYSLAASCPSNKNLCNEYKDPSDPQDCDPMINDLETKGYCSDRNIDNKYDCNLADEIWHVQCSVYYYFDNDKIDEVSCSGQVDRNSGCVLLYDANNWNGEHSKVMSYYDTNQTYDEVIEEGRPMSPVVCDPSFDSACALDSNKLIKVKKDRQCAEWLACKSSATVWDEDNRKDITICDEIDTCLEYSYNNNITNCKRWSSDDIVEPLTIQKYQKRTTGENDHLHWGDKEYIGYSIPGYLPLGQLVPFNFGDRDRNPVLVYGHSDSVDMHGMRFFYGCEDNDGASCSANIPESIGENIFYGECNEDLCWLNPKMRDNSTTTFETVTRGYANPGAPFPAVISNNQDRIQAFSGANICEGGDNGCEGRYRKATYGVGSIIKYYPKSTSSPDGFCISGQEGITCDNNRDCDTESGVSPDGVCNKLAKDETFMNWSGICLEEDMTADIPNDTKQMNYCNQWYPVSHISGTNSLYNIYDEAGYYDPSGNDALFCTVTEPYRMPEDRIYCASVYDIGDQPKCVVLVRVPIGAKVHLDGATIYSDVILNNYLRDTEYNFHTSDEPVVDINSPADNRWPGGMGMDYIEKVDPGVETQINSLSGQDLSVGLQSFFGPEHFGLEPEGEIPVILLSEIDTTFDITHDPSKFIEYFYYDEQVDYLGNIVGYSGINTSNYHRERTWKCEDDHGGYIKCPDHMHESKVTMKHRKPRCSWFGPRRHYRYKYCNPLSYNIYVKAEEANAEEICLATDCNMDDKGLSCLMDQSLYPRMLNYGTTDTGDWWPWTEEEPVHDPRTTSTIADMVSDHETDALCWGDSNCELIYCLEKLNIQNNFCEEFGGIVYNEDDEVSDIRECLDRVLYLDNTSYTINPDVNQNLLEEMYNVTTTGCLENANYHEDSCYTPSGVIDRCTYSSIWNSDWSFPFNFDDLITCDEYQVETVGTACYGITGGSDCFQQCQIITSLDPEANKSWVRTDIWWRNENTGRINDWESYYYDDGSRDYIHNDNVNYANIDSESDVSFTHFGAALSTSIDEAVVLKSPLSGGALENEAYTFFAHANIGTGGNFADNIDDDVYIELSYLFAKVFNLQLVGQEYNDFNDLFIADIVDPNTYAGPGYAPKVLEICNISGTGEFIPCRDASNNVIEGITINNQNGNVIESHEETLFVASKFYFYAHPDHMPITNVAVDWKDGSGILGSPGKYKNHIPTCDSALDMPGEEGVSTQGFGGLARACREGYKLLYHDYTYDHNYNCSANELAVADGLTSDIAACYKPEVTVTDRWGAFSVVPYRGWIVIHRP